MKMKRFVAAAIAAVSCLSFAACGSDTASKDENVIHIMSSGDSSANMGRALVDGYNKTADAQLKKMSGAESDFGFDMTVCSLF